MINKRNIINKFIQNQIKYEFLILKNTKIFWKTTNINWRDSLQKLIISKNPIKDLLKLL